MSCKFCKREINNKGSLTAHEMCCKMNPNKITHKRSKNSGAKKGSVPWNKGQTGLHTAWNKGKLGSTLGRCKDENKELLRRKKLSVIAKERKLGGYVKGSGRGKKGWYKGIFCDSSWELAYVIYCFDNGIDIKRNTEKRKYPFEGKVKNYIPDFLVEEKLIEIKGYVTDEWKAKIRFNPDVQVLYEKDLIDILSYVKDKHGKDYVKLYEETQES